jgi:hypothetical protein
MQPLAERRLHEHRLSRRGEREICQRLRFQFLPVALSVAELVGDDVWLEDTHVSKECHVTRQEVARPQREREDETSDGVLPYLRARLDPLSGDPGDVARQLSVDIEGQLPPLDALRREVIVQALRQEPDFVVAYLVRHWRQVVHVRAELAMEIDLPHPQARVPVLERASDVRAERGRLDYPTYRRRAEQEPRRDRHGEHDVARRNRPVRPGVGDADFVRRTSILSGHQVPRGPLDRQYTLSPRSQRA